MHSSPQSSHCMAAPAGAQEQGPSWRPRSGKPRCQVQAIAPPPAGSQPRDVQHRASLTEVMGLLASKESPSFR